MTAKRLPAWGLVIGLLAAAAASAQDAPARKPLAEAPPAAEAPVAPTIPALKKPDVSIGDVAPLIAPDPAAPDLSAPDLSAPDLSAPYGSGAQSGVSEFVWSFVKSMLMLGVVLALIYLLLHKGLGRLVQRTQQGRRMKVVERITLDQRRALYLVEIDGEEVLLAGSEGGMTRVDRPPPAPEPARFSTEGPRPKTPPITGVLRDDAAGEEAA
jgi:flagellar biogenesis protein FliO